MSACAIAGIRYVNVLRSIGTPLMAVLLRASPAWAQERELEGVGVTERRPILDDRSPQPLFCPGDFGIGFAPNPGNNVQVRDADQKDCAEQSGNPVVLSTGNKIDRMVDFGSADMEMSLGLARSYNHYWTCSGLFGQHWTALPEWPKALPWPQTQRQRRDTFQPGPQAQVIHAPVTRGLKARYTLFVSARRAPPTGHDRAGLSALKIVLVSPVFLGRCLRL